MSMTDFPLTILGIFFVTAIIWVISFSQLLLSAALLLIMDRSFGTSFFLSDIFIQGGILHYQGGFNLCCTSICFLVLGHPEGVYCNPYLQWGMVSEIYGC